MKSTSVKNISLDNNVYTIESLGDQSQKNILNLQFVLNKIETLTARKAVLNRAKNSYIDELKSEIIVSKSGVNLGSLLMDED